MTPELTQQLTSLLRAGSYLTPALDHVGLPTRTYYDWMGKGDPEGRSQQYAPHRRFRREVEAAAAVAEARAVAQVMQAAGTNWQAAAWWLERRYPDRWGRRAHLAESAAPPAPAQGAIDPWAELDNVKPLRPGVKGGAT